MWQRLQTVFLGLIVLIMIAGMFFPIWKYVDAAGIRYELYPLHYSITEVSGQKSTAYIPYSFTAVLMVAAASIAVQAIRSYNNRLAQLKLCLLNTLILMGVMGCAVFFAFKLNDEFNYIGLSRGALWTLFAGVACNWLAMRFIRRDEKIVRDSDRLR